jgi:hypothetical protein
MAASTYVVGSRFKGSPIVVPGKDTPGTPAVTYAGAGAMAAPAATPPVTSPGPPSQTTQQAPAAPPQPAPDASGPQWDAQRNAYIQWDPAGRRWLTYDDGAAEWRPIEGEQPPAPN